MSKYQEARLAMDKIQKQGMQAHYVIGAYEVIIASLIEDLPEISAKEEIKTLLRLAERTAEIKP